MRNRRRFESSIIPMTDIVLRIAALEDQQIERGRQVDVLQVEVSRLADLRARLEDIVPQLENFECRLHGVQASVDSLCASVESAMAFPGQADEVDDLRSNVSAFRTLLFEFSGSLGQWTLPPAFSSKILDALPPVLSEFAGKQFVLLWRGSEHGFAGANFHQRCNGHANTLTLVEDMDGDVFGGFTPVAWESREDAAHLMRYKADSSDPVRSFLFTVRNPGRVAPCKFPLRTDSRNHAIYCGRGGPEFGCGIKGFGDLAIRSN
jgi:hypothetical protein